MVRLFIFLLISSGVNAQIQKTLKPKYDIQASLDTLTKKLNVSCTVNFSELSLPKDTIYFYTIFNAFSSNETGFANELLDEGETFFYFMEKNKFSSLRNMKISSDNGEDISFFFTGKSQEILGLVTSGKQIESVKFEYMLRLPYLTAGVGMMDGDYFMNHFYPYLVIHYGNKWQFSPYDPYDSSMTYESDINLKLKGAEGFQVVSNGARSSDEGAILLNVKNIENLSVVLFDDPKVKKEGYITLEKDKKIPYQIVFLDKDKAEFSEIQENMLDVFDYFTPILGDFPYPSIKIMLSKKCQFCFSENGIISSKFSEKEETEGEKIAGLIIAMWIEGKIKINAAKDLWINDGLVDYYSSRFFADLQAQKDLSKQKDFFENNRNIAHESDFFRTSKPIVSERDSIDLYEVQVNKYYRSRLFFEYADELVGRTLLDKTIIDFKTSKNSVSTATFIEKLEKNANLPLAKVLKQYTQSIQYVDYKIKDATKIKDKISLNLENKKTGDLPVSIRFEAFNGNIDQRIIDGFTGQKEETFDIIDFDSIKMISIDSKGLLAEINRENNYFFPRSSKPFKIRSISHNGHAKTRDLKLMIFPAYNDNNGFLLGINMSNSTVDDMKSWRFAISPMYSFLNSKILGQAWTSYDQYLENKAIYKLSYHLGIKSFDMDRNERDNYSRRYIRLNPEIGLHFKHAKSTTQSSIKLAGFLINEENAVFEEGKFAGLENQFSKVFRLTYEMEKLKTLNSTKYKIAIEQQSYQSTNQKESYIKLTQSISSRFMYAENRNFYLRLLAAGFLSNSNRQSQSFQNLFTRGSIALIHQGFNDYTYDEYFFSRQNQNKLHDNMTSMAEGGGFKTPIGSAYNIGMSNNFALSANIAVDFPILAFPLRLYFDAGTYSRYDSAKNKYNNNIMYNGGISLNIKNIVAISYPFIFSTDLGNIYAEQHKGFFKKISFSLNLNNLDIFNKKDPFKI